MSESIMEDSFQNAVVETVRIINVNTNDWSVDCVSEFGYKRFLDVQVMSPYFHFMNGEGAYFMPEVGALAWLCSPSGGEFSSPFLLGYQAPFDEDSTSFRANRPSLNPGDQMFRTRDENFIILRRGGVIQLGATPITQRMYIPLRNIIKDFCENYELFTFGGEMTWTTARDDKTVDGSAPTKLTYKIKSTADEPDHVLEMSFGSHGDDSPIKMSLQVYTDGSKQRELMVDMNISNEGDVSWDVQRDWSITAKRAINMTTTEGDITIKSGAKATITAAKDMSLSSLKKATVASSSKTTVSSKAQVVIDAPLIKLGAGASTEPAVKGAALVTLLTKLITQISAFQFITPSGSPAPVIAAPAVAAITADLAQIISHKTFVE